MTKGTKNRVKADPKKPKMLDFKAWRADTGRPRHAVARQLGVDTETLKAIEEGRLRAPEELKRAFALWYPHYHVTEMQITADTALPRQLIRTALLNALEDY